MVDLFCGGATVGLNVICDKIIFIDNNKYVIGLLKYFARAKFEDLLKGLESIIEQYGLSNSYRNGYKSYRMKINGGNANNGLKEYNSEGFYKLRNDYNALENKMTNYALQILYILIVYGFNNDLRFSKEGNYNLPCGKTDLNANNVKKLREYNERIIEMNAEFICGDFENKRVQEIIKSAEFIYMDPPYLITNAVYNESNKWNEQKEYGLIELMNYFIDNDKQFILSNILEKKGRRNEPLYYWTTTRANDLTIIDIKYHYRNASYNKKVREGLEREVIIMPKRKLND